MKTLEVGNLWEDLGKKSSELEVREWQRDRVETTDLRRVSVAD